MSGEAKVILAVIVLIVFISIALILLAVGRHWEDGHVRPRGGGGIHDPQCQCDYADEVQALAEYVAKLEGATKLLSDDLYGSKDWRHGDMVERIHWLIAMLKSKSDEVNAWVDIANKNVDRIAELEARTPTVIPLVWQQMANPMGDPSDLHRAWCPLFEKYYWAERADNIPQIEERRAARIMRVIQKGGE